MIDQEPTLPPGVTVRVQDLTKHYPGRRRLNGVREETIKAVDGVSFSVDEGEILGLVGESGSGKSTTGALLLGLETPSSGEISIRGIGRIDRTGRAKRLACARAVQLVFQNPYEALNPRHTIGDSILEPIRMHLPKDRAAQRALMAQAMERSGLTPYSNYVDRYPHQLSGGQLQRVAIARAIALEPALLVADEPIAMLDVSIRASILNLFKRFSDELGMSIVYITHDLSTMRHLCARTAVMYRGKIIEMGPTGEVLDQPQHAYTRALAASVPILAPRGSRLRPAARPNPADAGIGG